MKRRFETLINGRAVAMTERYYSSLHSMYVVLSLRDVPKKVF